MAGLALSCTRPPEVILTIRRLLIPVAAVLLLSPPTATSNPQREGQIRPHDECGKHYSRSDFHRAARRSFKDSRYTAFERAAIRRTVYCTRSPRSLPILRAHLRKYKRAWRIRNESPRGYARRILGGAQFGCMDALVNRESRWNVYASNGSSGAYGIPQALPGSKMASAGPDWRTNGKTQVRWMLGYVSGRYGSMCGALGHSHATGWY